MSCWSLFCIPRRKISVISFLLFMPFNSDHINPRNKSKFVDWAKIFFRIINAFQDLRLKNGKREQKNHYPIKKCSSTYNRKNLLKLLCGSRNVNIYRVVFGNKLAELSLTVAFEWWWKTTVNQFQSPTPCLCVCTPIILINTWSLWHVKRIAQQRDKIHNNTTAIQEKIK